MIVIYQDWDLNRRFFAHAGESTASSAAAGFLQKGIKGASLLIDMVVMSISAPLDADLTKTYNLQLVTVDAAGAVSPASPGQTALFDLFKDSPVSATVNSSRVIARSDLRIRTPEGFGVGWQAVNATVNMETAGNVTYVGSPTFDIMVAGWIVPVASRETAPDDSFLQPAGSDA